MREADAAPLPELQARAGDDGAPLAAAFLTPDPRVLVPRQEEIPGRVPRAGAGRDLVAAVLAGDGLLEGCAGEEA